MDDRCGENHDDDDDRKLTYINLSDNTNLYKHETNIGKLANEQSVATLR